jgi:hypothetical protein
MTKIELALILKIIDSHTTKYTSQYYNECTESIPNVQALKNDIVKHYEEYLKEEP